PRPPRSLAQLVGAGPAAAAAAAAPAPRRRLALQDLPVGLRAQTRDEATRPRSVPGIARVPGRCRRLPRLHPWRRLRRDRPAAGPVHPVAGLARHRASFTILGHHRTAYSEAMPSRRVIGVDMGGTKLLAGVFDGDLGVHHRVQRTVVGLDQVALLTTVQDAVEELRKT